MNNNEDYQRGLPQQGRKPYVPNKFSDNRYSPSSNYNHSYNSVGGGYGNPQQQHPKRKIERFKRDSVNYNERLARQNDIIIRVLKEIRDRLPAPPPSAAQPSPEGEAESAHQDGSAEETRKTDAMPAAAEEMPTEDVEIGNEMSSDAESTENGNR